MAMLDEASGLDERPVERLRSFAYACSLWYLQNIERVRIYATEWKHLTGKRRKHVIGSARSTSAELAGLIGEVEGCGRNGGRPRRQLRHLLHLRRAERAARLVPAARHPPAETIAESYAGLIVATVNESAPASSGFFAASRFFEAIRQRRWRQAFDESSRRSLRCRRIRPRVLAARRYWLKASSACAGRAGSGRRARAGRPGSAS